MEISKAALGIAVAACVAAGAGGAYVATRQAAPAAAQTVAAPGPATGVEQSEGVVEDAPATAAEAPNVSPIPATPRIEPRPELPRGRDTRPAAPPAARPATRNPRAAAQVAESQPRVEPPAALPVEAPRVAESEPARPAAPPLPQYLDLVIPADAVIGLQVDTPVTTETARVEDPVVARVTRDVKVGDRVAIPAGSKAQGEVTLVERGGKVKERARLGVRFRSVVLADGTRVPIETDAIFREGDAPSGSSAAKIGGGAIGGAILGGLLGGAKGAVIGGSAGAGAGTAAVMAGGRSAATLSSGSPVTIRLQQSATVTVEQ
jgi:hypothetical protein